MTRRQMGKWFGFGPGLLLHVSGDRGALRHFEREYGPGLPQPPANPDVEVAFGAEGDRQHALSGGHKAVSWEIGLEPPDERPLRATVALAGLPRNFARSLVQGYFVEALLSVAAARRGLVLLPAAALEQDGQALVLLGRSGSGKSTLMARALNAGRRVLADDQLLIDGDGRCWPFPRRVRVYPDLRETAPRAYRRLAGRRRAALAALRVLERVSRGYLAPSLAVSFRELGEADPAGELPVGRVVLIERGARASAATAPSPLEAAEGLTAARRALDEQRVHLDPAAGGWPAELRAAAEREQATLSRAFSLARLERLGVPEDWGAARAIAALDELLQVDV